ncbi:MAG: 2-C-methyl-D-erythritol 4-phosphate cytidylyltransferase [Desulfobacterales bacterium]|nr:2-C-methyl-D-erythritol 4-phosphate cytidylyltransferase [Desulfobacterales bacterium]MCF8078233.1 2-C-methyl-D-erythritol 4-phosphate cytidylyltransferase [Desulfobacterales bacterium]
MGSDVPKQHLSLAGRPVLAHTISAFGACRDIDRIVVVAARQDFSFCQDTVFPAADCSKPLILTEGGVHRADSVFNGIEAAGAGTGIVVIHDGVRPLVHRDQIGMVIAGARENGACILACPIFDTLKRVSDDGQVMQTVNRTGLWTAQTPQAFRYELIRKAHLSAQKSGAAVTDDAQLLERLDLPVRVVSGDGFNLKITTPQDLKMAEALLGAMNKP